MKAIKSKLLLSLLLSAVILPTVLFPSMSWAKDSNDIHVIVNSQSELTKLSRKQVISLFLGRARSFPNGNVAKPFDNEVDSAIRAQFFESLTGKSISDIDAYWARLRYSGRASPPKVLTSQYEIVQEVSQNKHAIAYVHAGVAKDLAEQGIVVVHTLHVSEMK